MIFNKNSTLIKATKFILLSSLYLIENCNAKALDSFVVGGKEPKDHSFPYSVHLGIFCFDRRNWICGSSIINQRVLLTAAHCLYSCMEIRIAASAGHSLKEKGNLRSNLQHRIHKAFNFAQLRNDIGVIILKTPFLLEPKVQRVALMENPPLHETALIAGWGCANEKCSVIPKKLMFVKQEILNETFCLKIMKKIPQGTLCARDSVTEGYPHLGDSGCALVIRDYIQVGLVSYRIPSSDKLITIHTSIPYFYKWIQSTVNHLYCAI